MSLRHPVRCISHVTVIHYDSVMYLWGLLTHKWQNSVMHASLSPVTCISLHASLSPVTCISLHASLSPVTRISLHASLSPVTCVSMSACITESCHLCVSESQYSMMSHVACFIESNESWLSIYAHTWNDSLKHATWLICDSLYVYMYTHIRIYIYMYLSMV